jgi:hypothetical protein
MRRRRVPAGERAALVQVDAGFDADEELPGLGAVAAEFLDCPGRRERRFMLGQPHHKRVG